jgi:hypothetical protein
MAGAGWELKEGELSIQVTVPPNTTAQVYLTGKEDVPLQVGSGSHHWRYAYPSD